MRRQILQGLSKGLPLMFCVLASYPANGQDANAKYPTKAATEQYLMADRNAEMAMARSAAPVAISDAAKVLILTSDGYETAAEGTNGFTCLVERSWMSPVDSAEFWNPKMRGPICYNPQAVRTILPYTLNRTKLVLAGLTKAQMAEKIKAAVANQELPSPEPGAMSYMMSKAGVLGDSVGHWQPHLMFHLPRTEGASWGANLDGSPVVLPDGFGDSPEPETIFLVPVDHWSDGTPANSTGSHRH